MPDQIPDIYKAAIKRYEDITHKRLDDPSITRLTTLGGLKDEIDARNKEFTTFREKRHGIFAVLSAAMRPIELLGDLAAGGASMAFPPSSLVFGAVSFLINAAKDVSARYDAIVELMDTLKVSSHIDRCNVRYIRSERCWTRIASMPTIASRTSLSG
jgi:hypothetical protein